MVCALVLRERQRVRRGWLLPAFTSCGACVSVFTAVTIATTTACASATVPASTVATTVTITAATVAATGSVAAASLRTAVRAMR